MAAGEFRVLGTLEVADACGGVLHLGGPKPRALLAALLVDANEPVALDRLVDALWGATSPPTATHAVEVYVSTLRKALGQETIRREHSAYRLLVGDEALDARRFEHLLHRGEDQLARGYADRAIATLDEALALWRGAAFADVVHHDFARAEADRLEELRLTAVETRLEAELMSGRQDGIVAELQGLVEVHPFRERFRAQLMLALYRRGRQVDALELYRETRGVFREELGLEPAEELRELERRILAHDPTLLPGSPSTMGFLPAQVTTFIGREQELHELVELLDDYEVRLVTLVGPGGIGKTRLAIAGAAAAAPAYRDGVWFVDLSAVRASELLSPTLAEALSTQRPPADHIGHRHLLLVLDNFEQLLEAAPRVSELLATCPNLKVIVTSRERLRLRGEHVFDLSRLDEEASMRLFTDRARSVVRSFERSDTTRTICRRLEGVPLAIELAAARVSDLGQKELWDRLERSTAVAAEGPADAPPRQASVRAAVAWSYDLLDPQEKTLFTRLGVFAGGWTQEAAEVVAGATGEKLGSLVDKSLVGIHADRFTMLESIRELAADELDALGEADDLAERHVAWCLALAEQACGEMNGPRQAAWWERLDLELANLRSALTWLLEHGDHERAGQIAVALNRFWSGRGHLVEGGQWLDRILDRQGELSPATRARAQETAGMLGFLQGGGDSTSLALIQTAYESFVSTGDDHGAARCLDQLAGGHLWLGDAEVALELGEQALRALERNGDQWGTANCLGHLGQIELCLRRFARAIETLERCLAMPATAQDPEMTEYAVLGLGIALVELGRLEEAERRLLEGIPIGCDLGDKVGVEYGLNWLAAVAAEQSDAARAERLLRAAASIREDAGLVISPVDVAMVQPHLAKAGLDIERVVPMPAGGSSLAERAAFALNGR